MPGALSDGLTADATPCDGLEPEQYPTYNPGMSADLHRWLQRFNLDNEIHAHVAAVFARLPATVRDDLVGDPAFLLADYDPTRASSIPLAAPGRGLPSRSVVLKRTLLFRSVAFTRYIIAHELAHAHLRNRGRTDQEDPEFAADSLAADWGFPRPSRIV
ncbi:MAG: hypothetical protein IT447_08025 [Phycisphaerales bacterium]|jgi:hypothetical protein|nr:hypothetical protein [Phycisphaerales bacterium]